MQTELCCTIYISQQTRSFRILQRESFKCRNPWSWLFVLAEYRLRCNRGWRKSPTAVGVCSYRIWPSECCRKRQNFEDIDEMFDVTKVNGLWLSKEDEKLIQLHIESKSQVGRANLQVPTPPTHQAKENSRDDCVQLSSIRRSAELSVRLP